MIAVSFQCTGSAVDDLKEHIANYANMSMHLLLYRVFSLDELDSELFLFF